MSLNKHGFNLTGCWRHTTGFKMCGNLIKDFCIVWLQREEDLLFIYAAVQRQLSKSKSPPKSTAAFWAQKSCRLCGYCTHCSTRLSCTPLSSFSFTSCLLPSMSVSPLSAGGCGVTWCAEEDQWHAGGDSEENGQPVQTRTTPPPPMHGVWMSSALPINRYVEYSFHVTAYNWN